MSQAIRDFEKTWAATTDLSAKQYFIVKQDTANDNSIVLAAAATDPIVGVLQNKPKAASGGLVRHAGSTKVILGGTVTRGDTVTSDANGKAITTVTNKDRQLGTACQSGVAGDIIEVLLGGFSKQSF